MRDLIAQLKADNETLLRERQPVGSPDPGAASSSMVPPVVPQLVGAGAAVTERLVFIPRDRRCPKFSGTGVVCINEWVEEAQACMRVCNLSLADQAFFLFDHLEGEAHEEIKNRPEIEKNDPLKIISALREVYGCSESYVALQEAFFSRRQQAGETLLEFSLALMSLLEKVKDRSPHAITNADVVVRDQFIEYVSDNALRRRCQQPGHFARECNGERRPPCPPQRSSAVPSASESRPSHVLPLSGN